MATIGQLSNGGNAIPYWGYYGSGISFDTDPMSTAAGKQFLAGLQKFDPNATFVQGTSGGGEGGPGQANWTLQYDAHKLPGGRLDGTGNYVDLNAGDFDPLYGDIGGGHSFKAPLFNPNAVGDVATYGHVTSPKNVNYAPVDNSSWVDKYGPMLVGAAGFLAPMAFGAAGLGMGTSGAAQAAIGAANGGIADTAGGIAGLDGLSTPFASAVGKGLPNMAQSAANHNFNPVSLIPYGGAALGLPSWLTTGATTLGNLARGAKLNFNPVQLAIAATRLGSGGGQ